MDPSEWVEESSVSGLNTGGRARLGFLAGWFRASLAVVVMVVGLGGWGFVRLNFPYQGAEGVARLQKEWLGIHAGAARGSLEIIGHRGSGLRSLEGATVAGQNALIGNTERAIVRGLEARVDWIEVDVRQAKGGGLILFHDERIEGKTNGTGAVAELTLAELRSVQVSVDPPEGILTLEALGARVFSNHPRLGRETGLILDIKAVPDEAFLKSLGDWLALMEANGVRRERVILFGEYGVLQRIRDWPYRLGYTLTWGGHGNQFRFLFFRSAILRRLQEVEAAMLVIPAIFAHGDLIASASDAGIETWVYGSEDPRDWQVVQGLGATGIIVDAPARATIERQIGVP